MIKFNVGEAESKTEWSIVTTHPRELLGDDDSLANIDPEQQVVFIRPNLTGPQLGYVLCTVAAMKDQVESDAA